MSNIQQIEEQIDKIQNNNMKLFEIFQTVMELPENKTPETLKVTPTKEQQTHRGLYNVVTVWGEPNLVSENIKEGTSIFGVEGSAKTTNAKITNGYCLFYNDYRADYTNELLELCDWEKFTTTESMFYNCKTLISFNTDKINTSNLTNMKYMFYQCSNVTKIDLSGFNTTNVTDMSEMFNRCNNLTELDVSSFDTSNVTNMYNMFNAVSYNSKDMISLDISNFDMSKVIDISGAFGSLYYLENLKFGTNLGKGYTQKSENYSKYGLNLSSSKSLTHESLMSIINGLYDLNLSYDVANGGTLYRQSLKLGSTNLAKLTAEEIAIATNKGWNVT